VPFCRQSTLVNRPGSGTLDARGFSMRGLRQGTFAIAGRF
jgi:hypothetical protein